MKVQNKQPLLSQSSPIKTNKQVIIQWVLFTVAALLIVVPTFYFASSDTPYELPQTYTSSNTSLLPQSLFDQFLEQLKNEKQVIVVGDNEREEADFVNTLVSKYGEKYEVRQRRYTPLYCINHRAYQLSRNLQEIINWLINWKEKQQVKQKLWILKGNHKQAIVKDIEEISQKNKNDLVVIIPNATKIQSIDVKVIELQNQKRKVETEAKAQQIQKQKQEAERIQKQKQEAERIQKEQQAKAKAKAEAERIQKPKKQANTKSSIQINSTTYPSNPKSNPTPKSNTTKRNQSKSSNTQQLQALQSSNPKKTSKSNKNSQQSQTTTPQRKQNPAKPKDKFKTQINQNTGNGYQKGKHKK